MENLRATAPRGNSAPTVSKREVRLEMEKWLIIHLIQEVNDLLDDPLLSQALKLIYNLDQEPVPDHVLKAFVEVCRDEDDEYDLKVWFLPECQTATEYCRTFVTESIKQAEADAERLRLLFPPERQQLAR